MENKPVSMQGIILTIEEKKRQIKTINMEIKVALEEEEVNLKEKGYSLTILERHEEFAEKYETNVAALITCLDEVCDSIESEVCSSIQKTLDFIDQELLPEEPCLSAPLPEDVKKPEFSREKRMDVKGVIKQDGETSPAFSPPAKKNNPCSLHLKPLKQNTLHHHLLHMILSKLVIFILHRRL